MIRVGIVGFGKMGILHTGILNALPDCSVVAVCEKEALLRKIAKKLLLRISFHNNVLEMIERNSLDVVYVTTPIATHLPIVRDIVKSSRRVGMFIEKPLAGNYEDAKQITDMASTITAINMIGFQKRFVPQFLRVKELLNKNVLGELRSFKGYSFVSGVFSKGNGWRFKRGQGGSLLDLGSHLIDLILWYFGNPMRMLATERSIYSEEVEDFSHVSFDFPSGLTGSADVSWSVEGYRLPETQLEIDGTNGKIVVNDDSLKIKTVNDVLGVIASGNHNLRKPDLVKGVDFLLGDPEYCVEDKYFLECLAKKNMPSPGLPDGLRVNEIAELIHKSAQEAGSIAS